MTPLTLNSLFFGSETHATGQLEQVVLEEGKQQLDALKEELRQQLPKFSFKALEKEIGSKIGEVLNVGVEEVLAESWKKYEQFQAYADPEQHPPEETILVPLARHIVESQHNPRVDLMIKKMVIGSIALDVHLLLSLEGIVLRIQGGRILGIEAGSCQAKGSLEVTSKTKIGNKTLLTLEKETPKLELDVGIRLAKGVVIPRLPAELEQL